MSHSLDGQTGTQQPQRIAILECDEPIGKTKEKYGSYGGLFQVLLEAGAEYLTSKDYVEAPRLDISKHDIVNTQDYPALDNIDAILLTGSRKFQQEYHCDNLWLKSTNMQDGMHSTMHPGFSDSLNLRRKSLRKGECELSASALGTRSSVELWT